MEPPSPQRVLEVHLDEPLPRVEAEVGGRRYASARVLVRLHRHPLGVVELDLGGGAVSAERLAREVRAALGDGSTSTSPPTGARSIPTRARAASAGAAT